MADRAVKDIMWLAGLLEGEGCFYIQNKSDRPYQQHSLRLSMSDKDIVERAAEIMGCNVHGHTKLKSGKTMYRAIVYGPQAAGWMMTLYPLMGQRRQKKIREVLSIWKTQPSGKSSLTKYNKRYLRKAG